MTCKLTAWLARHQRVKRLCQPAIRTLRELPQAFRRWVEGPEAAGIGYAEWVRRHGTLTQAEGAAIVAAIARMRRRPLISVAMPVYDPDPAHLLAAIRSVQSQLWPEWELCIADDASPDPRIPELLAAEAAEDPRIRWVRRSRNEHIAAASNSALALANGEWLVLLDHDDLLAPEALYEVAAAFMAHPTAQVIYTDEDKIDAKGRRRDPYFKPDLDPDLLLAQNMVSHLGAYRLDLLRRVGGFRQGFEGSQDHDLALRCLAEAGEGAFLHLPRMLYHWRQTSAGSSFSQQALERCTDASRRAVQDHLACRGIAAEVVPAPLAPSYLRVIYDVPDPAPMVSVIIAAEERPALLRASVMNILERTEYPAFEVLVAEWTPSTCSAPALSTALPVDARLRVLPLLVETCRTQVINAAAHEARGEILVLLDAGLEGTDAGWLRELVSQAVRPGIGAVGAKLLRADGRVGEAGIIVGLGAFAARYGAGAPARAMGRFGWLAVTRSVSAVTAACLAVKRADFIAVGGLGLGPSDLAGIALCQKLRTQRLRNLVTPHAVLLHRDSVYRATERIAGPIERPPGTADRLPDHGQPAAEDPCWNPNLGFPTRQHGLVQAPRLRKRVASP